jgi:3-oxoacyl-[acyl-carrier protein] reductase
MASALGDIGAMVVGVDRNVSRLDTRAREWRARRDGEDAFLALGADISAIDDCKCIAEKAIDRFGRIDILINCAGVSNHVSVPPDIIERNQVHASEPDGWRQLHSVPFWEALPEGWLEVVAINSSGAFLVARFCVPHMVAQGWGRIINVTTSFDTMLAKGRSAYGSAKAALEANTAIWAKDLEGTGVTANVVTPGGLADTGFVPPGVPRDLLIPASVMGPVVQWLVSDAAEDISGCRFVARDWDASLPPDEAAAKLRAAAAWPDLAELAIRERADRATVQQRMRKPP